MAKPVPDYVQFFSLPVLGQGWGFVHGKALPVTPQVLRATLPEDGEG